MAPRHNPDAYALLAVESAILRRVLARFDPRKHSDSALADRALEIEGNEVRQRCCAAVSLRPVRSFTVRGLLERGAQGRAALLVEDDRLFHRAVGCVERERVDGPLTGLIVTDGGGGDAKLDACFRLSESSLLPGPAQALADGLIRAEAEARPHSGVK